MKKILFSLAAGTAMASAPAMAQNVAPVDPFSGFHVEALAGYDVSKAGSSVDDDVNEDNDQSIDGFAYGVGAGYDFRAGNFVVGPEAEVTWSTAKTSFDDGDFEGFGIGNVKTNRDLYVGARVGYVVTPKTMIYAKGGYTNAKFDVRNASGTVTTNRDLDADGWRIGAGVEQAISNNVFAKLEYRYSNYEKGELDYRGDFPDGDRFDLDLDRHQVMAGVGVRF
ncbi:outer membrane protein [Novosphingobium sp. AP12]|uniref:outer membrane protein n=1 Tax=Novosphingobium sp. AP12 TaxID=1144305 RepID=UPI000271F5C1|nr:outer membrane protein [Novosphingobium sp. AP12]EJL34291.1 outer membrane autotransporter barrel domain-containing protein [Novosphingobium sp. AP12]